MLPYAVQPPMLPYASALTSDVRTSNQATTIAKNANLVQSDQVAAQNTSSILPTNQTNPNLYQARRLGVESASATYAHLLRGKNEEEGFVPIGKNLYRNENNVVMKVVDDQVVFRGFEA